MRLQGKSSIVEAPCPSAVPDRHFETRPKRLRVVQYVHSRKCFLKLITFLENKICPDRCDIVKRSKRHTVSHIPCIRGSMSVIIDDLKSSLVRMSSDTRPVR